MWYLRAKDFVTVGDDSDYALTATGADYVEKKAIRNEIVGRLLNPGGPRVQPSAKASGGRRKSESPRKRQGLLPGSPTMPNAVPNVG